MWRKSPQVWVRTGNETRRPPAKSLVNHTDKHLRFDAAKVVCCFGSGLCVAATKLDSPNQSLIDLDPRRSNPRSMTQIYVRIASLSAGAPVKSCRKTRRPVTC